MPWREESIVSQRLEFVTLAAAEGANIRGLCRRFGVSPPTAYKWLVRHAAGEELADRSRRPVRSPGRCAAEIEAAVLGVRAEHPAWGARKIRAVLERRGLTPPSASTVHAVLVRHGCIGEAEAGNGRTWRRFEHERPNALWQMDFKGHVPLHRGGRCHPLTILDDHSRFALAVRACANEQETTTRTHLISVFRRFGLPERVLCDHGPPWGTPLGELGHTRLSIWLLRLGVRVVHGRVRHPQTQGKAERFHRTLKAEVFSRMELRDLDEAQAVFERWRGSYNLERPHEALGMGVPAGRYSVSERAYPETLPEIEHAPGDLVRRVNRDGMISFQSRMWYLSVALIGERVALRVASTDGVYDVCLGPHPVGRIDLRHTPGRATRQHPPVAALPPDADGQSDL